MAKGHAYTNLMLAFSIVVVLGGIVYLLSYRNMPTIAFTNPDAPCGRKDHNSMKNQEGFACNDEASDPSAS
jgi:hypothetical protein